MRIFSTAATALCLCLLSAVSSAATPAAMTPATMAASDAAAKKHAKRTACLKDVKSKKLVGTDKTAFLKSCIAAP